MSDDEPKPDAPPARRQEAWPAPSRPDAEPERLVGYGCLFCIALLLIAIFASAVRWY
ncbi:MAG TPA: hypothetical protein VKT77_09850 [Chthonomonadaceae bacterium]|nr:hypothetical protein [Chthonomonadaceae bacterium]